MSWEERMRKDAEAAGQAGPPSRDEVSRRELQQLVEELGLRAILARVKEIWIVGNISSIPFTVGLDRESSLLEREMRASTGCSISDVFTYKRTTTAHPGHFEQDTAAYQVHEFGPIEYGDGKPRWVPGTPSEVVNDGESCTLRIDLVEWGGNAQRRFATISDNSQNQPNRLGDKQRTRVSGNLDRARREIEDRCYELTRHRVTTGQLPMDLRRKHGVK